MSVLLSATELSFGYGSRLVLRDINLAFNRGELVGLIGPNGSGKSTLLRLLGGMETPAAGRVTLMGQALTECSRRQLARQLTLVSQHAPTGNDISGGLSVQDVVAMGRHPWLGRYQPPGAEDRNIIAAALRSTDLTALADRRLRELSGGERQRVMVARAIAQQTPIVLLDEATASLDICHQLEVLALARQLVAAGHLVIAAIHDLALAARYCDRLLLVADEQVQADGAPIDVVTEANLLQFFHVRAQVDVLPPTHPANIMITALDVVHAPVQSN